MVVSLLASQTTRSLSTLKYGIQARQHVSPPKYRGTSEHTRSGSALIYCDGKRSPVSDTPTERRLCGELREISDDTERPEPRTAEKSPSEKNPHRHQILSTSQLSSAVALMETPFSLRFWKLELLIQTIYDGKSFL